MSAIRNWMMKVGKPPSEIRINGFAATFLARASLIMSEPKHQLYSSLHSYFAAKQTIDLNSIPEFMTFFQNSTEHHLAHRHWILQVLRDGLKMENDFTVAANIYVFKIICAYYGSCLADEESKVNFEMRF